MVDAAHEPHVSRSTGRVRVKFKYLTTHNRDANWRDYRGPTRRHSAGRHRYRSQALAKQAQPADTNSLQREVLAATTYSGAHTPLYNPFWSKWSPVNSSERSP